MTNYVQNQTIIQAGEPFTCFHIITGGSVSAVYDADETAKSFVLKKGDVIGIFDFGFKEYSFTYKALENTSVISYSLSDFSKLAKLLEEHKEVSHFLVLSMVQNVSKVMSYYATLKQQQDILYQYITNACSNYTKLCQSLGLTAKTLANKELLVSYVTGQEEPAFWLEDYYQALKAPVLEKNSIFSIPSVVVGMLARSVSEIHKILYCCEDINNYLQEIGQLLLNDTSLDLFNLYTDLLFRAKNAKKDTTALEERIQKMISIMNNQSCIDHTLVTGRIQSYELELKRDHSYDTPAIEESLEQIEKKLAHSVDLILDYADTVEEIRTEFVKYIDLYKELPDKNSPDKNVETIRRQLTKLFNIVYIDVFQKVLHDPTPPIVIKMFLHFAYMDLELAGVDNAAYLYSIAPNYQGDPKQGVYTLYEWITAIHQGKKPPSRNELSQDFVSYVQTLRSQGKLDAQGAQHMLENTTGKVLYELENMFPVVNKVTNGRFTTFCPIFIQENVVKGLDSILVTPYKIKEALGKILEVDFSAFYRTYLFSDDKLGLRENVLIDVKPDFVLMPNIGSNGICWQEIEGMQRSTPGRMMVSAFHAENLEKTIINMIGDFRWELCRRIQGARWNDVTEHSLTSEYYDYAMFYAKNRDLSQDAKEKIKLALGRARNNFKNLFIADYANWILYEAKGAVKLNKVARRIFSTYIPFPADTCEAVASNGAFTEPIQAYTLKKRQQLHRLQKLTQKYQAQGRAVPEPLENHIRLLDM